MSASVSEENRLLDLVFPYGVSADWEYNPHFNEYISKLGSYKLEELAKEPSRLKDEKHAIKERTQELATTNYKTFIETAQCSRQLFTQFNEIDSKVDRLLDNIPNFEKSCEKFCEGTSGINTLRKLNSLTLTKSAQLLEILELPQLMNSFINDSMYEDALELATYVQRLHQKNNDITIFKSIADDVDKAWLKMLHQLLSQLRHDITLPNCLQIVGHLRRMEIFSESELRLKFLQSRDAYLQSCLHSISNDNVNHHLTKTTDVTRVNLFNIITQYRAIFNDDEHNPLTCSKGQSVNQNVIFYSWIKDKIAEFLQTLENDLKLGVSSLESIIGQCMYFGLSFSKVGCDFRLMLIPIFTNTIKNNFKNAVCKSQRNFEKNIDCFTLINKSHPGVPWRNKNDDPLQPPTSLLEFYPLADYLNNILIALNELRVCAPIAIIDDIVEELQISLILVAKSIVILYSQEQQAFTATSKDAFTRLCMCFADDLVPYLQKCINVIFPPTAVASQLGVNAQYIQTLKIMVLDKDLIIAPIKHLLPTRIDPVFNSDKQNSADKELNTIEVINTIS